MELFRRAQLQELSQARLCLWIPVMDRSDRTLLGLAQRRHNYSSSTCRRLSGELDSQNWAGQWLPQVSNTYLCYPFSLILCVWTPLRTLHLTTGGVAGRLWLWIINDQTERQRSQASENLAFLQSPNLQPPTFMSREGQLFSHSSSSCSSTQATSLLCNLQCCGVSAGRTLK